MYICSEYIEEIHAFYKNWKEKIVDRKAISNRTARIKSDNNNDDDDVNNNDNENDAIALRRFPFRIYAH